MGASPTPTQPLVAAAVCSTEPSEVRVEEAADGEERVFVEGTMFHDGLNSNHWGLTESGAKAVADSLVGRDYTAAHPPLRGTVYDRAIDAGQGAPIGTVTQAHVIELDTASLDGGQYTASYETEVLDPTFKDRLANGLATGDGYGVSIGVYANPEEAVCSVCRGEMASDNCEHSRGEKVEIEADGETVEQVAGPLYPDAQADHLAHVWRPAYDGTTAEVDTSAAVADDGGIAEASVASAVPEAATVLAEPFDAAEEADSDDADTAPAGYAVSLSADASPPQRGSYDVQLNHE